MKGAASAWAILAVTCGCAHAGASTPIGKAIQLLTDLRAKIVAEGTVAQKVYDELSEFCEDRSRALHQDIKTSETEKSDLKASIAEETAMSGSFNAKIEELAASTATDEADLAAATKIRASEAVDFIAEEKELTEMISTLTRAVGILEREMQKGGASMLQLQDARSVSQALSALVQASALTSADGAKLEALVQATQQSENGEMGLGAPDATVYEGHSGDIISTLEGLLDKTQEQLTEMRKKETMALHNFELLKQSLLDGIKFSSQDMAEAKKGLAASGEKKATAEGNLEVTTKDLEVDTKILADLHHDCMTKAQDFEAATVSRNEEVKAIAEAVAVLQKETGGAEKVAYGLGQLSFAQVGRADLASGAGLARFEVVHLLRDLARKHHSLELTQLARRVAAVAQSSVTEGQDPFAKVKSLISDMIERLEDAASADASTKAYCDKELAEAQAKKAEKDGKIGKLSTKIEQMATRSAQLKAEVAALQKSLSALAGAQAEMDKLRSEEHEAFLKSRADTEQGLKGTKLALKILREYYAGASGAHAEAKGAGSSIVGLLEVVESDLSKALAGLTASEEHSKSTYDGETKENQIDKASKDQDVKYKAKEASELDVAVAEATSDRSAEQAELDAVVGYLKSLDKQCISKPETYAERKARREAEMAGLKQALSILEGEAALIQRRAQRTLRGRHTSMALD